MKASKGKLTPRQQRVLSALLMTPTIAAAAVESGIGETTIHRFMKDPVFQTAYREVRRRAVEQAVGSLQQTAGKAVAVLAMLMADDATPRAVRVSAASKVLDLAIQGTHVQDLAERVEALEQCVSQAKT